MSFLEEFNEHHRAAVPIGEKQNQELNRQLLQYYSEMLVILREVLTIESNKNIKHELCDEIGDVLHRMGCVIEALQSNFGLINTFDS